MSTSAFVDSVIITQANEAQSSRVPVPLPDDPYLAGLDDEGQGLEDEGPGMEEEEEESAPEGQQQAVLVVDTAVSESLGLGYGAERISVFRQPTFVTWVDLVDGRVYTNIPTYAPPAAHVQTPPSPEWSSGSLPVSPSSPVVPLPIASPVTTLAATILVDEDRFLKVGAQLELYKSILHDHTQRLDALPPSLFKGYDRDLKELYTRLGAVRDEIFSQRYRVCHIVNAPAGRLLGAYDLGVTTPTAVAHAGDKSSGDT
nr:hypothetical protein [Tanacetum cinerariifolium]